MEALLKEISFGFFFKSVYRIEVLYKMRTFEGYFIDRRSQIDLLQKTSCGSSRFNVHQRKLTLKELFRGFCLIKIPSDLEAYKKQFVFFSNKSFVIGRHLTNCLISSKVSNGTCVFRKVLNGIPFMKGLLQFLCLQKTSESYLICR